jgi:hypothetical protein
MDALMPFGVGQVYRVMFEDIVEYGAEKADDIRESLDVAFSELENMTRKGGEYKPIGKVLT